MDLLVSACHWPWDYRITRSSFYVGVGNPYLCGRHFTKWAISPAPDQGLWQGFLIHSVHSVLSLVHPHSDHNNKSVDTKFPLQSSSCYKHPKLFKHTTSAFFWIITPTLSLLGRIQKTIISIIQKNFLSLSVPLFFHLEVGTIICTLSFCAT